MKKSGSGSDHTPTSSSSPSSFPDNNTDAPSELVADIAEQNEAEALDDAIPSRGYHMLPMVGLGASAGGLSALQAFFKAAPVDSGMVFVIVTHLSSEHESILADILQRSTSMPVVQVRNTAKVEANSVYVIPPGHTLISADGFLKLSDLDARRRLVTVDIFFRTLAETHGPSAIAIVLSGLDGDGAVGIKRIKERGGLTIVQDPNEAEHPGMPRASLQTGMVDWTLPAAEMPQRVVQYWERARRLKLPKEDGPQPAKSQAPAGSDEGALREVLAFLRNRTGHDFTYYKRATIVRRVGRRMQVNGVDDMASYLSYLRMHPGETGALLQDLLITVTNFFRDPECFEALEKEIAELFSNRGPDDTLRVWVPACATGEEAYSIAMLMHEHARAMRSPPQIQIFATDLDAQSVQAGRQALYPEVITADVSQERLARFFIREQQGYRVKREIRETVLFAVHDLLKDSPFSRLDLVSCRNLMIYLTEEAKNAALNIFHFGLDNHGRLFLGASESVEEGNELFAVIDRKHRTYRRKLAPNAGLPVAVWGRLGVSGRVSDALADSPAAVPLDSPLLRDLSALPPLGSESALGALGTLGTLGAAQLRSWSELHLKLIERFAAPSLLVNRDQEIVHISHSAGRFLHFGSGEPTRNLMQTVHPMLRIELRAALFRATQKGEPVEVRSVPIELDESTRAVSLRVVPASDIAPDYMLVFFEPHPGTTALPDQEASRPELDTVARELDRELDGMRSHLRDVVEQYEASTEELRASNEELQAMNEELRSTTEELESGREEMHSINEELTTVNQELKAKVDELAGANSDLHNLMASNAIATVFLDRQLRIKRFTPSAAPLFNLISTDVGRPLSDLNHRLEFSSLEADAQSVLDTLIPVEKEVAEHGGRWHLARMQPYRSLEDRIEGVVLTLIDTTLQRQLLTGDASDATERAENRPPSRKPRQAAVDNSAGRKGKKDR